jgi:transglutaminase-like putative cysteine protease
MQKAENVQWRSRARSVPVAIAARRRSASRLTLAGTSPTLDRTTGAHDARRVALRRRASAVSRHECAEADVMRFPFRSSDCLSTYAAVLALGVAACVRPACADAGVEAPVTLVSDVHEFVLQRDGSLDEHDDSTLRANDANGIDAVAQRYVWFDKHLEKVVLLAAETIDRDGTAHPVGPDGIRDVQEPRSAGAPTFQDGLLRTVVFPGVEAGSSTRIAFRKTRSRPVNPGYFGYYVEPSREPVDSQRLIFDVPSDMPLYADARGYVALPPVTANGRTRYEFTYRHGAYERIESGAVGYPTYGDRLVVSTLPDYAAFAARYRNAAVDPTASDAAVVQLARALTAGAADPYDNARILYDWVQANVRYVALFLGETAAAPHRVADILRNRYGDCKDHVALFGALLAAVGIRSEPVLINLGAVYTLPAVPGYGGGAINHAITWLPDLRLYADTTTTGIAFGYLPPIVMDRPALLVDTGVLSRTPATQPRRRVARLDIDAARQHAARFHAHVEDDGWTAELERSLFRRATPERIRQIAAERVRQTGLRGRAELATSERRVTAGPFDVSVSGTLDHLVWPDGTTAVPALSSMAGGIATQVDAWLSEPVRTQPWVCIGGAFDETGQIALPPDVVVTDLPADTVVRDRFVDFTSHYVFDAAARIVQITRRMTADFGTQVCTPDDFAALRASLERIERDTHAQIVVRAKQR